MGTEDIGRNPKRQDPIVLPDISNEIQIPIPFLNDIEPVDLPSFGVRPAPHLLYDLVRSWDIKKGKISAATSLS